MTNKVALVPQDRSVAIDRTVNDVQAVSLADAIGALMGDAKVALGGMQPDDVQIELSSHADRDRSSCH